MPKYIWKPKQINKTIKEILMQQTTALYPALIYKNQKSNIYVANCIIKKLIGYGHTEIDAIKNLEKILNNQNLDYQIKIKPVYQFLENLTFSTIK